MYFTPVSKLCNTSGESIRRNLCAAKAPKMMDARPKKAPNDFTIISMLFVFAVFVKPGDRIGHFAHQVTGLGGNSMSGFRNLHQKCLHLSDL